MKKRADIIIVERKLARSRTLAATLVREGSVVVDGRVIEKPSVLIEPDADIEITKEAPFVGRGGLKLDHALNVFNIDVKGMTAVDIGSSTGGFTDCLLKRGAQKVYAVDVGTNQLVESLRSDPRVVVMEQTDIRTAELPEKVDLAVIDASFISLTHILPVVPNMLKENGKVVALIKPQFEVGRELLGKHGVVKDEKAQQLAIDTVIKKAEALGFAHEGVIESPIFGGAGNHEFLVQLSFFKK